ncbi:stage II sporulation protein P [Sporolactobacillus kofuensis]|uniref:Stage II sporulation protein P n=1 Tax=Sporolactobacillus kofuensis TaxID=269672 RepID=A0ABW1WI62_9BACL|nr:stage II sporulation protein P [Sporolactobacillus kofuensis]MCO7176188.1 stage II sporulation protein P [Sporolactobacillus kofuensis]
MRKITPPKFTHKSTTPLILKYLIVLILIYGLAILISLSQVKISSIQDVLQKANWPAKTLLIETFGNENVLFNYAIKKQERPKTMNHLIFEAMTELHFDDIRSLFGSELPGFTIYNTKIFIAGKGLNYTNLPQDNPPSPEIHIETPKKQTPEENTKDQSSQKLKKRVLIYHTHPWEAYKPMNDGKDSTYTDLQKGVIKDGEIVGQTLNKDGVGYVHRIKQGWGYNEAYQKSRLVVLDALKKNPTLSYLIDIHRDSSGRNNTTMEIGTSSYARISIIIGEANPNYSANLFFAKKVKNQLDKNYPDLVRGIVGKTKLEGNGIYNQDISKNAILVEIGGVDNTLAEITRSSQAFGEALAQIIKQTK